MTVIILVFFVLVGVAVAQHADIRRAEPAVRFDGAFEIPRLLSYQGRLLDSTGIPVPDTTYEVEFRLFEDPDGGSPFWSETRDLHTEDGLFAILLGEVNPLPQPPPGGEMFLSMTPAGKPEMMPRTRIGAAPFSFRAEDAEHLQGFGLDSLEAWFINVGEEGVISTPMLQTGAVNTDRIENHTIQREDVAPGFTAPFADTAFYAHTSGGGGGGSVMAVAESLGIICTPNPITSTGFVSFNHGWGDARYVNAGEPNSVASGMIVNGTVARDDVAGNFKAPFADTADYARAAPGGTGTVEAIAHDTGLICTPNPITSTGSIKFNKAFGDGRYLNTLGDSVIGDFVIQNDLRGHGKARFGEATDNSGTAAFAAGYYSAANGNWSTVPGGAWNTADSAYATVSGGKCNYTNGSYAVVGGGNTNRAANWAATVAGGSWCRADGANSAVLGGSWNEARGPASAVAGGLWNEADSSSTFVGGGEKNYVGNLCAVVVGGELDSAVSTHSVVVGGYANRAAGQGALIGAGRFNRALGPFSAIAGGDSNTVNDSCSFVGAGAHNSATGLRSVVCGGHYNSATGVDAFTGGGTYNAAESIYSVVAGGIYNRAGSWASVVGGASNHAAEDFSCVLNGYNNYVGGGYSVTGGYFTKVMPAAIHTFAWGENCSTATPRGFRRCA